MRVFICVDVSENVKKEIKKIQNKLPEFFGKKTETENLHLTLKFLGEISEEQAEAVKKKLGEIEFGKFEAEIDEIGVFSEKFVKIVWLHLSNCEKLQKEVDGVLGGLFEKEKRFMSHITIARVKNIEDKKKFIEEIKEMKIEGLRFGVDKFYLKESVLRAEGPEYKVIGEYFLGKRE